ncbi:Stk1 family PASTA domain-containing Ser/Thr kinase [Dermatophilaceae bacterium Soc4.6]
MTAPRLLGNRYEVGELIGRGGMADVHRGVDTRLERPVAIKILRTDLARDPTFLARFRREAQSAAGLNHPSIVAIFDSGEDVGSAEQGNDGVPLPYIVMEVVDGETLRERLERDGPLPARDAGSLVEGVLSALDYSHRMGIVHRDIKPANVMVTRAGQVKVMDYGIARAVADSQATMTQTQAVIGTAQYLSPEQAQGQPVDARTDLYSTGCLLYELVAGRPPFLGDSPVSVAYQHVREPAQPPSIHVAGVPAAYDTVTLHALVKDRERRYQSATEFRTDLIAVRAGRPVSAAAAGSAAAALASGGETSLMEVPVIATSQTSPAGATTRVVARTDPGGAGGLGADTAQGPADPRSLDTSGLPTVGRELPPGPRRRRGGVALVLTVVGVVALLLSLLAVRALIQQNATPDQVAVPTVTGQSLAAAQSLLVARNLTPEVNNVTNETVASGQVIGSSPAAGTKVEVGSPVRLDVSTGPGQASVPDVAGKTQEEATAALQTAGLRVTTVRPVDLPDQAKGKVVATEPSVGTVVSRTQGITLDIATGKVVVPDLAGKHFSVAQATLSGFGLVMTITAAESDQLEGTVLSQTPPSGSVVDTGTKVALTVAKRRAPTPSTTTVTVTPTTPPRTATPTTTPPTTTRTKKPKP